MQPLMTMSPPTRAVLGAQLLHQPDRTPVDLGQLGLVVSERLPQRGLARREEQVAPELRQHAVFANRR
jgi:hypothetical protein